MSDFGAAARMDWTLSGTPFEAASFKWGLPLLPHLYEDFSRVSPLPAFEVCLDRILKQSPGSIDSLWAKQMAQRTDVCLLSRLSNLAAEKWFSREELERLKQSVNEISPRWVAFAVGFNSQNAQSLHVPLPVPKTHELVELLAGRIKLLQKTLGREIAITNVASMFPYSFDSFSESEFWKMLVEASGAKILFDVPAFYVSLFHQNLDFETELAKFPLQNIISVRVGALAVSNHGAIDAECGRLSVTHWGLLEDVLHTLPVGDHKAIFLKWFEPLVQSSELVNEIVRGQSTLRRLGEL